MHVVDIKLPQHPPHTTEPGHLGRFQKRYLGIAFFEISGEGAQYNSIVEYDVAPDSELRPMERQLRCFSQ